VSQHCLRNSLLILTLAAATPAHAEDGVFDSKGVKIRYVTAGTGDAIVLIHGWMGDSSTWGRDAAGNTKLNADGAKGFQSIALDCRGHGKSDKPHDSAQYGAEMAEDVVRLLDHLKIRKAHLIGYSMGAFIAGKVAATHPDRVLSIVYGGQAPLIATGKWTDASEVEVFATAVEQGKDPGAYILEVTPPDKAKPTAAQAKAYAGFMFGGKDVKAFAAAGRSFRNLVATEEALKKCKAPVLFIHGGGESANTKERVAALHKMLDRSEVKVVEGANHITTLARPEFASALKEFVRTNKQQ
jgi:pimeloyl-ACP methyl ester carboxylesterase